MAITTVDPVQRWYAISVPTCEVSNQEGDPRRGAFATGAETSGDVIYVSEDYVTVDGVITPGAAGSTSDQFINVPSILSSTGTRLPTAREVEAIYSYAQNGGVALGFQAQTPDSTMTSASAYQTANINTIQQLESLGNPTGLRAGHRKDVVGFANGQVAIYGAYDRNGDRIQPYSTVHGQTYADYSHGIRLVSNTRPESGEVVDMTGTPLSETQRERICDTQNNASETPDAQTEADATNVAGNPNCYSGPGSTPGPGGFTGGGEPGELRDINTIPPNIRQYLTTEELAYVLRPDPSLPRIANVVWDGTGRTRYYEGNVVMEEGVGITGVAPAAMAHLIILSRRMGRDLNMVSAYRTPEFNATISGAATNSYHMQGIAFDVATTTGQAREFIRTAREQGFGGIGGYISSGFVHIDLGPDRHWGDYANYYNASPLGSANSISDENLQTFRTEDYIAPINDGELGPS